jgi:hypothetical protein
MSCDVPVRTVKTLVKPRGAYLHERNQVRLRLIPVQI